MSNSLRPHGLQPARLLCPWDFPGNYTGVGCLSLLQGIFPTQGSNLGLPHYRQDSLPSELPGKTVHMYFLYMYIILHMCILYYIKYNMYIAYMYMCIVCICILCICILHQISYCIHQIYTHFICQLYLNKGGEKSILYDFCDTQVKQGLCGLISHIQACPRCMLYHFCNQGPTIDLLSRLVQ